MREDDLFLRDVVEACASIDEFLKDRDEAALDGDKLLRSAILNQLTIIGEAASPSPMNCARSTRIFPGTQSEACGTSSSITISA